MECIDQLSEGPDRPIYNFSSNIERSRKHHIHQLLNNQNHNVEDEKVEKLQHECDLFLLSSHSSYLADISLYNFADLGRRNVNGWGIGYYQNENAKVVKSNEPANNGTVSREFKIASQAISSPIILGHLRFTSRGTNRVENNHPFKLHFLNHNWLFIHNGSASSGIQLVPYERRLLVNSDNDSPRIFEFLREKIVDYVMSSPKKSLIEACRNAFIELLKKDPNGSFNIILSNGHINFVFIHWRTFYLLKREKGNGDTMIISTLKLNDEEEWIPFDKLSDKRAKMLVFSGPSLIFNGDI
ncbi:MAG: class II glutamine amidotransferase [Desulfitobacteriia bacterium]|jgi:predicted glutamine amidotransferase